MMERSKKEPESIWPGPGDAILSPCEEFEVDEWCVEETSYSVCKEEANRYKDEETAVHLVEAILHDLQFASKQKRDLVSCVGMQQNIAPAIAKDDYCPETASPRIPPLNQSQSPLHHELLVNQFLRWPLWRRTQPCHQFAIFLRLLEVEEGWILLL
eukprot:gb/GEZN01011436.1/.p1 GENE.gb/GEZN01011436.1/~~gb/GEZN01011436.1/.p1  ORF type:complete len:156 (+),score=19.82 gb/GEZN01011436.1/:56-523(+)